MVALSQSAKHILLVEERAEMANVLRAGLERLGNGLQVQVASDAGHALQVLQQTAVDLLIVDIALPGLSGMELMARGRQQNPGLKTILLSADRDPQIHSQAARAGAEAFFVKPVELADLLDAVERIFGLARGFLPPEIQVALPDQPRPAARLSGLLEELHFNLQAAGAILFTEHGQVLTQAGSPPESLQSELMPHLLSALRAAGRIAPEGLQTFRTPRRHLHLSPVGRKHGLLLISEPLTSVRLAAHAEAIRKCTQQMLPELQNWPAPNSGEQPAANLTDPNLEKVLDEAETKPTSRSQTDKYWKEQEVTPTPPPGALTYEQASRLGLAPRG